MIAKFITVSLSYLFGLISEIERPRFLARSIVSLYKLGFRIDLTESLQKDFTCLQNLFLREISIDIKGSEVVSPIEGYLRCVNRCSYEVQVAPKGARINLGDLVAKQELPIDGTVYNFYLSPSNYHRVHMPFSAKIVSVRVVGGSLWPVQDFVMALKPDIFVENERVVFKLEYGSGELGYLVMVGAYNVGKILVAHEGGLQKAQNTDVPYELKQGDLLGAFALGSAVVLITNEEYSSVYSRVQSQEGQSVKVGDAI